MGALLRLASGTKFGPFVDDQHNPRMSACGLKRGRVRSCEILGSSLDFLKKLH